jgi:hypothetical protein
MTKQSVEFKYQCVRDLCWAVASPPMIAQPSSTCHWPRRSWYEQAYEDTLPWLKMLDQDPAGLQELLAEQKDRRLGKYFETLWLYWFSHHPRYQVIENNLQIIIDGKTLGEMDLIVFDKLRKNTIHWELAVKFYLGVSDTRDVSHWYGPNLNDRLQLKLQSLLDKQSVISQRSQVSQWLQQQDLLIDECAVILKGRLYYPWQGGVDELANAVTGRVEDQAAPVICAQNHLRGMWCTAAEFDMIFDDNRLFIPLINRGWMERIPTHSVKRFYSKNEIFEMLSNNMLRLPLQVQVLKPYHRRDRVFITGANWP